MTTPDLTPTTLWVMHGSATWKNRQRMSVCAQWYPAISDSFLTLPICGSKSVMLYISRKKHYLNRDNYIIAIPLNTATGIYLFVALKTQDYHPTPIFRRSDTHRSDNAHATYRLTLIRAVHHLKLSEATHIVDGKLSQHVACQTCIALRALTWARRPLKPQ